MSCWLLIREWSKLRKDAKIWVEFWNKLKLSKRFPILSRSRSKESKVNRSSNNKNNKER